MKNQLYHFDRAMKWIHNNHMGGKGIILASNMRQLYPEVTGYYIPTLIQWGERDLAKSFAQYLASTQKNDGSWYDADDKAPYVFDTAQILKGLIAAREMIPDVDAQIKRGCDWLLTNMQADGRLVTPSKDAWGSDESYCSELIHIYCLSPLVDAAALFERDDYRDAAHKILAYYKKNYQSKIENFSLLSHFYAYVMEGLYDLGETDLCRESMMRLEKYRNAKGGIPGLNDVPWVCSTGLFQLALVWYKLGDLEKGNSLFYYGQALQNRSGGWYGSYPAPEWQSVFYRGRKKPYYFPKSEISWAVKYYLDALAYKEKLEKEVNAKQKRMCQYCASKL